MQPAKRLEYTPDPNKFDLRTHVWNAQGQLVSTNLYRKFIMDGSEYYERPVNSGNLWLPNNQPAGRMEYELNEKGHIIPNTKRLVLDAPHKEYTAPLQGAEKLHYELEQARAKSAALEAELASIKADQTKRIAEVAKVEKAAQAEKLKQVHVAQEGLPPTETLTLKKPAQPVRG